MVTVTAAPGRRHRRAAARAGATWRSAYGDGTVRTTARPGPAVALGAARPTCRALYRRLAAAGLGGADAHTLADVTSCPGAESCRLAVTQSRGLGRCWATTCATRPGPGGAARRTWTSRSAAARTAAASTTWPASASRAASASWASRVVPQYFVMVGGGADDGGAQLRPPGRQDPRPARARGGGAADRALPRGARAGRGRHAPSSGAWSWRGSRQAAGRPGGARRRATPCPPTSSTSATTASSRSRPWKESAAHSTLPPHAVRLL